MGQPCRRAGPRSSRACRRCRVSGQSACAPRTWRSMSSRGGRRGAAAPARPGTPPSPGRSCWAPASRRPRRQCRGWCSGCRARELQDHVAAPRLPGDDRPVQPEPGHEGRDIVGDRGHVVRPVRLRRSAVPAEVHRHGSVTASGEPGGDAVPHAGVGREAMDQDEWRRGPVGAPPGGAGQVSAASSTPSATSTRCVSIRGFCTDVASPDSGPCAAAAHACSLPDLTPGSTSQRHQVPPHETECGAERGVHDAKDGEERELGQKRIRARVAEDHERDAEGEAVGRAADERLSPRYAPTVVHPTRRVAFRPFASATPRQESRDQWPPARAAWKRMLGSRTAARRPRPQPPDAAQLHPRLGWP